MAQLLCWWSPKQKESWLIEQDSVKIPLTEWILIEKKEINMFVVRGNQIQEEIVQIWDR